MTEEELIQKLQRLDRDLINVLSRGEPSKDDVQIIWNDLHGLVRRLRNEGVEQD